MRSQRPRFAAGAALAAAGLALAGPAFGAGFGIFEQGTKAMGMAGAYTAQADDPSAIFHNPGGIAFQKERDFAVGFTWIRGSDSTFEGSAAGFPGAGARAEQETLSEFPPHFYWIEPINDQVTFGLGVYTPFGLVTEWKDPDDFPGRFISAKAALRAVDINPVVGFKVGDDFGVAVGAIARFSDVELIQHAPARNPFTNLTVDVATIELTSDFDSGYGWNVGLLHRFNDSFSWGLSYRSKLTVDYGGEARLTQNSTGSPLFDAVIAASLPFGRDLPVETSIEFPDMASLGVAIALSRNTLLEVDYNWTGWSSFDTLVIDFTEDDLDDTERLEGWDDASNYRLGLSWTAPSGSQWRVGYVYDETPQPEEAVSPLLPDADRDGITLGWGKQGAKVGYDVALMYLKFEDRTRERNFASEGAASTFFGTYQNEAWLLGLTFGF
jgi:long-chain fatty acid transport protein